MRKKRITRRRIINTIKILILLLVILVISGILTLYISKRPLHQDESKTTELVQQYAKFSDIDNFRKVNVNQTYYSVSGKNSKNQDSYAIVSSNFKKIRVLKKSDGISEAKAKETALNTVSNSQVENSGLILFKNKPAWMVSLKMQNGGYKYITINLKDGKVLQKLSV